MRCPHCGYAEMEKVQQTDGMYKCPSCTERTHEKIEDKRDVLEELANSDLAVAPYAEALIGESNE